MDHMEEEGGGGLTREQIEAIVNRQENISIEVDE
jgi:hypothetical protein